MNRSTQPLFPHARFLFGVYAVVLFLATHWPEARLPMGPIPRPDLLQHLVAFGVWSGLFTASGIFAQWNSRQNIVPSIFVGLAYACIDEGLQAIPAIRRVFGWEDMAFNILGILAGVPCTLLAAKALSKKPATDRN